VDVPWPPKSVETAPDTDTDERVDANPAKAVQSKASASAKL